MSILVPDRWIFIVKAGRAFSYGRERSCRLKRNIPRKIKTDTKDGPRVSTICRSSLLGSAWRKKSLASYLVDFTF
jgi:hypothetical protein